MNDIDSFITALRSACGFSPLTKRAAGTQLHVTAKISDERKWVAILRALKVRELSASWSIDISRMYFLVEKDINSQLGKRWRIVLQVRAGSTLESACKELLECVHPTARPAAPTLLEDFPLPGGGLHRVFDTSKGKGATETSGGGGGLPAVNMFGRSGS